MRQPADVFAWGVASGDPTPEGVVLWTRVEGGGPLRWTLASDEALTRVVASGEVEADPLADGTVHVDVGGLDPATTYWYRFDAGLAASPVGRTRTARAADDAGEVRLGVVSCSSFAAGPFLAFAALAERDVDAVVHLGDVVYDVDGGDRFRDPEPDGKPLTLADYRARHAQARTDADFQALLRRHPLIATWDDHDVAGNTWRGGAEDHDDDEDGPWEPRRAAGLQAWREWLPLRLPDPAAPERVWRALPLGAAAELLVLDTRHDGRDRQVESGDPDPAAAVADPSRSLLSAPQRAWLHDRLRQSGAAWRVLANQVVLSPIAVRLPDAVAAAGRLVGVVVDSAVVNTDQWDGYVAERDRLLGVLGEPGVGDTAVLTGDVHSSWALEVPGPGDSPVAVELVTPAVTSESFATIVGADNAVLAAGVVQVVQTQLDHVRWAELRSPGYAVVSIAPERLQGDWWHVDLVDSGPERHAASWSSAAGSRRLVEEAAPLGERPAPPPPEPPGDEAAPPPPRPERGLWDRVRLVVAGAAAVVGGLVAFRRRRGRH